MYVQLLMYVSHGAARIPMEITHFNVLMFTANTRVNFVSFLAF